LGREWVRRRLRSALGWFIDILQWVFVLLTIGLSSGCAAYWLVVAGHILRTMTVLPTLRKGLRLPPSSKSVCIVVPAHNEESSIARLIESIRTQDHQAWSAVLALDRCTDRTQEVALGAIGDDPRITIKLIDHCPENWAGKVHAVWQAVQETPHALAADSLLFIDADTWMHPGCVRSAMALQEQRGDHLLSVLSTLDVKSWYERLAQSVAGYELARWYPPMRASSEHSRRPFANGQFLLFNREAYETIGTHEAAKDHLLEDLEFARRIDAFGLRGSVLFANGMLRCRMYDDWPAFVNGWKRIYTECANRRAARLKHAAQRLILSGLILPAAALACVFIVPALGWSALGAYALGLLAIAWGGGVSPLAVVGFPIGTVIVARILLSARRDLLKGIPTKWAGRTYVREAR